MDNTASINDKELIIDLDKLNSTQSLGAEEYIRKDIIIDIVNKIDSTVKSNIDNIARRGTSFNSASLPIAQHPCFFIHGERGSGKSTLLRGIIEALNNENRFGLTRSNEQKIELLTYVDPTEFAKGENFFIYILSKIADRLNKHKKSSTYDDDPYSYHEKRKEKHKKIIEIFQDMAEGLKFIQDTRESLHKSEDAAFFFEDYISKCSGSAQLKQKFAELLEEMCELEHVDAYVVAIDDADINFGKCSEIMETVRNYMIAPRLVILFAGDMKLYSLVARDTHIERFSPTSLQHDTSRTTHRNTLLEQLEDQYLLKLFPVNGRAYLGSFYELLQSHGSDSRIVTLKHPGFKGKSVQLQDFLRACMKVLVSDNTEQVTQTFLASQPMRSMLQLLNLWANTLTLKQDEDNKITISNDKKNISHLTRALSMAFSQALIQHRVDFTLIAQGDYGSLIKNVLLHVSRLGGKLSHTRLLADAGDESERKVSFYLNAEVLHNTTSFSRQLKYMFYVFPLIQFINNEDLKNVDKQSNKVKEIDDIERFVLNSYYSSYGDKYDEWGAWCTALLAPNPDSGSSAKRFGSGAIRVNKQSIGKLKSIQKFVTELCENTNVDDKFVYAIYHSLCSVTNNTGTGYYLSIYRLISLIYSILDINETNDKDICDKILSMLNGKVSFPHAAYPLLENKNTIANKKSSAQSNEEDAPDDNNTVISAFSKYFEEKDINNSIVPDILKWYKDCKDSEKIIMQSPCRFAALLENSWHKFYSKCKQATDDMRQNDSNHAKAGDLFVKYMKAFTDSINRTTSANSTNIPDNKNNQIMELGELIESFPLWKAITNKTSEAIWNDFNNINIGYRNTNHKKVFTLSKTDYNKTNSNFKSLREGIKLIEESVQELHTIESSKQFNDKDIYSITILLNELENDVSKAKGQVESATKQYNTFMDKYYKDLLTQFTYNKTDKSISIAKGEIKKFIEKLSKLNTNVIFSSLDNEYSKKLNTITSKCETKLNQYSS